MFNVLNDHILDQDPLNNHVVQLVYVILRTFFIIRLNYENSRNNQVPNKIRQVYTKLILFNKLCVYIHFVLYVYTVSYKIKKNDNKVEF